MKTASSRPPWADHSEAGTLGDWGGEPGQAYKLCVPHQELHPHHGPPAVTLENDLHIPIYLGGTKVKDRMWQKSVNRAGSLRKESRPMSGKSKGLGGGLGLQTVALYPPWLHQRAQVGVPMPLSSSRQNCPYC